MAGEHGVCTCPACCPDKWAANRLARQQMFGTGAGIWGGSNQFPPPYQAQQIADILDRLDQIEAMLRAHIKRDADSADEQ